MLHMDAACSLRRLLDAAPANGREHIIVSSSAPCQFDSANPLPPTRSPFKVRWTLLSRVVVTVVHLSLSRSLFRRQMLPPYEKPNNNYMCCPVLCCGVVLVLLSNTHFTHYKRGVFETTATCLSFDVVRFSVWLMITRIPGPLYETRLPVYNQ